MTAFIDGISVKAGQEGADGDHEDRVLGGVKGLVLLGEGVEDGIGKAVTPPALVLSEDGQQGGASRTVEFLDVALDIGGVLGPEGGGKFHQERDPVTLAEPVDLVTVQAQIPGADNQIVDSLRNKREGAVVTSHLACGMSGGDGGLEDSGIERGVVGRNVECPGIGTGLHGNLFHATDKALGRGLRPGVEDDVKAAIPRGSLDGAADDTEGLGLTGGERSVIRHAEQARHETGAERGEGPANAGRRRGGGTQGPVAEMEDPGLDNPLEDLARGLAKDLGGERFIKDRVTGRRLRLWGGMAFSGSRGQEGPGGAEEGKHPQRKFQGCHEGILVAKVR